MTEILQGTCEVIGTGVMTFSYFAISQKVRTDCDHKKLGWIAVTSLSGMTGVFIVLGCFDVMKISVLNGVWSGIAGFVIIFGTATELIKEFRSLVTEQVAPTIVEQKGSPNTPEAP